MVLVSHWLYQSSEDGVKAFCIEILKYLKPLANLKRSEAMESSHRLSLSHLKNLWSRLFECLTLPAVGALATQSINRQLFNSILISESRITQTPQAVPTMKAEEENAVCYASGYISMKLQKLYMHHEDKKSVQFVSCLAKMVVAGNEEGNYYHYTSEWIR